MSWEMLPELQTADQFQQPHQQWERGDWWLRTRISFAWLMAFCLHPAASLINYHCGDVRRGKIANISVLQSWHWWTYQWSYSQVQCLKISCLSTCTKYCVYWCIILMLLKLDNSSDCVNTSLVGNVTGSGALLKCLGNINVCSVECVVWCPRCRLPLSHCQPP